MQRLLAAAGLGAGVSRLPETSTGRFKLASGCNVKLPQDHPKYSSRTFELPDCMRPVVADVEDTAPACLEFSQLTSTHLSGCFLGSTEMQLLSSKPAADAISQIREWVHNSMRTT